MDRRLPASVGLAIRAAWGLVAVMGLTVALMAVFRDSVVGSWARRHEGARGPVRRRRMVAHLLRDSADRSRDNGRTARQSLDDRRRKGVFLCGVDVHIRRIRSKLGPGLDLITTVRGVGYRLDRTTEVHIEPDPYAS